MILNSKTYAFSGVAGAFTRYAYRALGLAQLFSWVTAAVTQGKAKLNKPASTRVRWNILQIVPVPEDSACGCEGDIKSRSTVYFDADIDGSSDAAARADLLAQIQDLVLTAEFAASITNLEQPYT